MIRFIEYQLLICGIIKAFGVSIIGDHCIFSVALTLKMIRVIYEIHFGERFTNLSSYLGFVLEVSQVVEGQAHAD